MRENKFIFGTSIAPFDIEKQKRAINSWIQCGVKIISYNAEEEIVVLEKEFPEVTFIKAERDTREVFGKPYTYMYDLIKMICQEAEDDALCVIINSDIVLNGFTENIKKVIIENSNQSLIYAHRQDVLDLANLAESKTSIDGIDIFFFKKDLIDILEDDGLVIGQPVWDYWLPLVCKLKGKRLVELKNPIGYHLVHPVRYQSGVEEEFCEKLSCKYLGEKENKTLEFREEILSFFTQTDKSICYVNPSVEEKSVLVIVEKRDLRTVESLLNQTHTNLRIYFGKWEEVEGEAIKEEYILIATEGIRYHATFLQIMIEQLETKHVNSLTSIVNLIMEENNQEKESIWVGSINCKEYKHINQKLIRGCTLFKVKELIEDKGELTITSSELQLVNYSMKHFLTKQLMQYKRYWITPAGKQTQTLLKRMKQDEQYIIGVLDNNPMMYEKKVMGFNCFPINKASELKEDEAIIINSKLYNKVLYEQLKKIVPTEKIIIF